MASPLGPEHKIEIERHLAQLAEVRKDLDRAKAAGIDVADLEAQHKEMTAQLQRLKAAYFPTGRQG